MAQRERVIVEDVEQSSIFIGTPDLEIQLRAGVRAMQSTPLISRSGNFLGTFSTHYKSPGRPDDRVLRLLDLLSRQAADIIDHDRAGKALNSAKDELEKRVRERTEELARRANQLSYLASQLTLSEQRERRRMAKILHDHLQQLLVGAKFRLTVLGRHEETVVQQATGEVEGLINEAIESSRSLTAELCPPILHEGGFVEGLKWLERWFADKHGLFVDLQADDQALPLKEDVSVLVFESVRELLFNAVKHAQVHSATISARKIGEELQVVVADKGIGFDSEAFLPAEKKKQFGLFSIQERLEFIGGKLEIQSTLGVGSRFVIRAPLASEVSPEVAPHMFERMTHVSAQPPASNPGARIAVLLADDHAVMREGLAQLLSLEPDIEIVGQAADGEEAVALASELLPDVILMDMSMPKLNGVEATRIIHNDYPDIQIIGLSMFEEPERAQALRDAGAVDYLTKSGPPNELLNAIRKAKRMQDSSPSTEQVSTD